MHRLYLSTVTSINRLYWFGGNAITSAAAKMRTIPPADSSLKKLDKNVSCEFFSRQSLLGT